MNSVVAALLRGETPEGFDELRSRHTARILAGKRVDAMAHVRPELTLLPQWRPRAIEFVLATPNDHCAHWDADMFGEWVRDHPRDGDTAWSAVEEVRAGRRRAARVVRDGHRHLVWRARGRVQSWPALDRPSD